jgi:hypothetical protein
VFLGQARNPGGGLIVMPDVFNVRNSNLIISVPTIYFNADYFAGGLITYGDNYPEERRLAAGYIDHILKSAKPEEPPIQPTKFELVINDITAKAARPQCPSDVACYGRRGDRMSRPFAALHMSAFGGKADIGWRCRDVCF